MKKIFCNWFMPVLVASCLAFIFSPPVTAQTATTPAQCFTSQSQIPTTWQNKFPFAFVYYSGSSSPEGECPKIKFWGMERTFCSPVMLMKFVRWIFVIKIAKQGLINL